MQNQLLRRLDLDTFNKSRIQQKSKEVQEILEKDLAYLQEFLDSEKAEKQANSLRRDELRKEMILYRDSLAKDRQTEKERQVEIEGWYSREQERVFKE